VGGGPASARAVALVLVCAAALLGLAAASGAVTIASGGPVTGIALGDDLSCQVSYVNDSSYEFYPPDAGLGDCGTFLVVGDTLYAPDFAVHDGSATWDLGSYVPFEPVSQTGVMGSGTAADPFRVRTVVDAPGTDLRITEETTYVSGAQSYRVETSVENQNPDAAVSATLYHAGDCYASGSDVGYGFTRPEIRSAGCAQNADNVPAARTIQMAPLSSGSHFYEAGFYEVWQQIGAHAPFPDSCRCGEHIDNGVGLSWGLFVGAGNRETRALTVAFTESAQPAPQLDSDGDALPDAWETGGAPSADYENLAPLGADPHRKDVFVHADYMRGCKPPAGWESDAIRVFAAHGIALHIDAGADSINADGRPWGALSRAGELPYSDSLAIWGEPFDVLKDAHFVASNRRRAFHYMAFVNQFTSSSGANSSGGQSRGPAGDADFVVATCHDPGLQGVDRRRWTTVVFVHELGHNLGLRHGGYDDIVGKPSYYGIMNYFWAFLGGTRLPSRLMPAGAPSRLLPDYSESVRTAIDENHVDERDLVPLPVAWVCPGKAGNPQDVLYEFGSSRARTGTVDWDCDGIAGERPYGANLNGTVWGFGDKTLLGGYDDWAPYAMKFDGGGVLGDFDIPPQQDPPVVPELTAPEVAQTAQSIARTVRLERKQLTVSASRSGVRARRRTRVRVRVLANGHAVRAAIVHVQGARVSARSAPRTDRDGRLVLVLRPRRHGDVTLLATHRGFRRGGIVVAVKRRR